ncbi:methylenetetrahydrofolate reductase C-terminal domain-containing protein [Pseudomonas syringae]|nr:methylenetetrahydrofolate reductase C-terminal domain-containing protein [Pseudomonas syringae]MBD8790315.1 methylenetetrahydrofolate reductase C-terminal domain-containing protein [Pseudomonas syringae]MBD8799187.1 methylenetetrahydrofolate reductase C-terminal domain-containing protein [Pseudomonas syringae]MBD8810013.1 methylenetetrahydrofolate reductase C-terminal domain-containing protein [Pseudomonas syringae]
MNLLKQALHEQRFICLVEFVPKPTAKSFAAFEALMQRRTLCGWPLVATIADRVASRFDLSPLDAFDRLADPAPALLHFSGKDRERHDLLQQLEHMDRLGLEQLFIISGDRLPGHEPGQQPVRYLESVPALQQVRQARPDWLLGAALNPFKYREEEGGAQYFKARKKLAAGADFLTLQLGFDAHKHLEALTWMRQQPSPRPLLACLMALTHGRATMLEHVAGTVVSPSMRAAVAAEAEVSKAHAQQRSISRLGLQVIGLKLMGYAGVELSGIHDLTQLQALEQAIEHWQAQITTPVQWSEAWQASWQTAGQPPVTFHPPGATWQWGQSTVSASLQEKTRYHLLAGLHHQAFSRTTWLSRALGWGVRRSLWSTPGGASALHRIERSLKRPMVGCDTCGQCRLEDTLYICPETCPKGLANGPCGGTTLNRCEFGDRECIHSIKYRTAKAVGQTAVLTERLIPCIEADHRHRSSWPGWFDAAEDLPSNPRSRFGGECSAPTDPDQ